MNTRTKMIDLFNHVGEEVSIQGFVATKRDQSRMQFLILQDETGRVQLAHDKTSEGQDLGEKISSLTIGSTVEVKGRIVKSNAKAGGIEIVPTEMDVTSLALAPLPIDAESSQEKQLDWRHISLRSPKNNLTFRVQTTLEHALREFWHTRNFVEIHSPKLMGTPSESGAELFELDYFGRKAYLAQSPQFYKQMAIAAGFGNVFEIGPVFRANPSFTSRHDTEFTSVDMEMSWVKSHYDVMEAEEQLLAYAIGRVADVHGAEIKEIFGRDLTVPLTPFPKIAHFDALQILKSEFDYDLDAKGDLDPEGERKIARHVAQKYGHEFVFITDYPVEVRAFYHKRHEDNPRLTKSFDLLWNGLEITTGAQRENRVEQLREQAHEKGLTDGPLEHYFNFFRYGCPPHGGCGIGLTRMLMNILNRPNVREVTFLHRAPNRLTP